MSYDIDGARQLAQRLRTETADKQSWDYARWATLLQMAATHLDNASNVMAAGMPARGTACELQDQDHDSPTFQQWFPARFVALDLVGGEPIVQREGRMPVFATWGGVRGIVRPSRAEFGAVSWKAYTP